MKKQSFIKGAGIIAAGGFIAKLIGALYRIPLTNLIGGRGIGLYQMAYPFYCLLLTVSATGIPSSIAKTVAERRAKGISDKPTLKSALILFSLIGGAGSLLMAAVAPLLARAQNCTEVTGGYYMLAPSVFLVSAISVLRGWFQGRNNMIPTALSEITEQLVKAAFGLLFAYLYRGNVEKAVIFLLLSVSISELAALIEMIVLFRRVPAPFVGLKDGGRVAMKSILRLSIPVTLSAALLPLSSLLDSVIIVRLLGRYTRDGMSLYGIFSGAAITLMNLPVSVCYGVAAASVPAVSAALASQTPSPERAARRKIFYSLAITLAVSIPSAIGLYFLAKPVAALIFRALAPEERETLVKLVKVLAVSVVTLSCTQTLSACLTGLGKPKYAFFGMAVAVAAKTLLNFILISNPKISVYGAAIATDVCYLVAFSFDLVYNLYATGKKRV